MRLFRRLTSSPPPTNETARAGLAGYPSDAPRAPPRPIVARASASPTGTIAIAAGTGAWPTTPVIASIRLGAADGGASSSDSDRGGRCGEPVVVTPFG